MELLAEEYNPEDDTFFVVITKSGKDMSILTGDQRVVGEFNLKSVVTFIVKSIHHLCTQLNLNPFVFISRHVTAYFIEQEKQAMTKLLTFQATMMGVDRGQEMREPEEEEGPTNFIFNINMVDQDN
jgi:hypothetical protein